MTDSSFCIEHVGSGCEFTDDGSPLSPEPRGMGTGGGESGGVWQTYFVVPGGLTLQIFDSAGPACEMHQFSLQPYGDADIWACENSTPRPDVMDLAVTKGNTTQVATIRRQPTLDVAESDPVTTTGYRIGDIPVTIDDTLPWLLVVDRATGTIVGYVRSEEFNTPSFDNVVLVYNETGKRIGKLDDSWQLAAGA
jgi:hypothetical protein